MRESAFFYEGMSCFAVAGIYRRRHIRWWSTALTSSLVLGIKRWEKDTRKKKIWGFPFKVFSVGCCCTCERLPFLFIIIILQQKEKFFQPLQGIFVFDGFMTRIEKRKIIFKKILCWVFLFYENSYIRRRFDFTTSFLSAAPPFPNDHTDQRIHYSTRRSI